MANFLKIFIELIFSLFSFNCMQIFASIDILSEIWVNSNLNIRNHDETVAQNPRSDQRTRRLISERELCRTSTCWAQHYSKWISMEKITVITLFFFSKFAQTFERRQQWKRFKISWQVICQSVSLDCMIYIYQSDSVYF